MQAFFQSGILVATTGAALLASISTFFSDESGILSQSVVVLLALCSLLGGIGAAVTRYRLNNDHLLRRWMRARTAPESERLGYSNHLVRLVTGEVKIIDVSEYEPTRRPSKTWREYIR